MSSLVDLLLLIVAVIVSVGCALIHACVNSQAENICAHSWCSYTQCAQASLRRSITPTYGIVGRLQFSEVCEAYELRSIRVTETAATITIERIPSIHSPGGSVDAPFENSVHTQSTPSSLTPSTTSSTNSNAQSTNGGASSTSDHSQSSFLESTTNLQCPVSRRKKIDSSQLALWNSPGECGALTRDAHESQADCIRVESPSGQHLMSMISPSSPTTNGISRRSCGAWIQTADASTPQDNLFNRDLESQTMMSMALLCHSTSSTSYEQLTPTSFSRMRQMCSRYAESSHAIQQNDIQLATDHVMVKLGYALMDSGTYRQTDNTIGAFADAVGKLSSYGCSSFINFNVVIDYSANTGSLIQDGDWPSDSELILAGVAQSARIQFQTVRERIASPSSQSLMDCMQGTTNEIMSRIVRQLSETQSYTMTEFHSEGSVILLPTLFVATCHAINNRPGGGVDPQIALDLLNGVTQVCVHRYASHIDNDIHHNHIQGESHITGFRMHRRPTDQFEPPSETETAMATRIGLNAVSRTVRESISSNPNPTTSEIDGNCFRAIRRLVPDMVEHALFQLLVSSELQHRLMSLFEVIRENVITAIQDSQIRTAIRSSRFDDLIHKVRRTQIRLKGAAEGTPGGSTVRSPRHEVDLTNGFFINLMELSRLRNVRTVQSTLTHETSDVCDGPAVLDITDANTYFHVDANCIHVLLGLLQPPFVHVDHTESNLMIMVGFFLAHELAHATIGHLDPTGTQNLLQRRYEQESVYLEAIADVISMRSIMEYVGDNVEACKSSWYKVAQLFCSNYDLAIVEGDRYPQGNTRVDRLWLVFKDKFPQYACL